MPSCDGSNCGACACSASLESKYKNLQLENEALRNRLRILEAKLEAERSVIRDEVEAEVRQNIEDEIRPDVERKVKSEIIERLIGKL